MDSKSTLIRLLVVEDSPSDFLLIRQLFTDVPNADFRLDHASTMADAVALVRERAFDAILLDLGLPDSQGVDTFVALHGEVPSVPILILTGADDDSLSKQVLEKGAEDHFDKKHIQSLLLRHAVLYAFMRSEARKLREDSRQREEHNRELEGMDQLSAAARTNETARIYSGGPLSDIAPEEFQSAVAAYSDILELALQQRIYRSGGDFKSRLRELGMQLGFMRCGPRDAIEIHTNALKLRIKGTPAEKAQAYLEEGRILVVELMGHLVSYYRSFYTTPQGRESL